jgi:hypothetical protein
MAHVFISYKRENQDLVQHVVKGLRATGLEVWWDQDIPTGAPWEETIERELQQAKVTIVAWSPAAVVSENVKAEARWARNHGRLIQVFVEGCEPPTFFGERQGVPLIGWQGNADDHRFQTVLAATQAIMAGKPPAQGVGYAPAKRRPVWPMIAAGVVGLALVAGAVVWVSRKPPPAPAPADPAAVAAQARQALIGSITHGWDRPGGSCAAPMSISANTDNAGLTTITVSGPNDFKSVGQVITAEAGHVMTRDIDPSGGAAGETWEYQPNGALMTVIDGKGVHTPLVRCDSK